jgi:UDP-glucose:(heptosyl)LPS alpha-1,3-glucosyltransferase
MSDAMPHEKLRLLHVVHRYGPVGGMERYVWELTLELQQLGHQVAVICERCHAEKSWGIQVHELGDIAARPHWLSQLRFSGRVKAWLKANPHPGWVIHSHERLGVHHLTTFHGSPFATIFERPFWRWISLRVWMRLYLERRELAVASAIVPNSQFIKQQLAHYYPQQQHKLTGPVMPGVMPGTLREFHLVPQQGGIIGFVGKEWRRKGLPLALKIVAQLRRKRPELELWVIGPDAHEVQHLFAGWQGGYRLLGWRSDNAYLRAMDVLLHPAKAEPYGMVISEAMAACVPVVVSNLCGAATEVAAESGDVLSLEAPLDDWVNAVDQQLLRKDAPPAYQRSWCDVALDYEKIYMPMANSDAIL